MPSKSDSSTPAVPLVDFSPFTDSTTSTPSSRAATAAALDAAFRETGFVYLTHHGVPASRIASCFAWSAAFFALPTATKSQCPHPPGGSHHRGWTAVGGEKVSQMEFDRDAIAALRESCPDVKESFESGNVDDETQPNIWPPEEALPGFRTFMESFFEDCRELITTLLAALSLALDLPSSHDLPSTHGLARHQLRLLHYPPVPTALLSSGSASRISAHSDFGTLTLLFQDAVGGLEVEEPVGKPGRFRAVEPRAGTVVVNVGDLLERWSNGRWRSTVHRVVAPPAVPASQTTGTDAVAESDDEEVTRERYSIPFFATADPDTVIEALPGTWDAQRPKQYDRVTAWEYVQMRMAALY